MTVRCRGLPAVHTEERILVQGSAEITDTWCKDCAAHVMHELEAMDIDSLDARALRDARH